MLEKNNQCNLKELEVFKKELKKWNTKLISFQNKNKELTLLLCKEILIVNLCKAKLINTSQELII